MVAWLMERCQQAQLKVLSSFNDRGQRSIQRGIVDSFEAEAPGERQRRTYSREYRVWSCCSHFKNTRAICLKGAPRSRRDGNGNRERDLGSFFILWVLISCTWSHTVPYFSGQLNCFFRLLGHQQGRVLGGKWFQHAVVVGGPPETVKAVEDPVGHELA